MPTSPAIPRDLSKTHWAYFQIMEATNAHDYTKSDGVETWR